MRSLRFLSCLLVSHRERRGRFVEFHPIATVLKGPNDTGKSSIVKSLYQALGADPELEHPRWKAADVSTVLTFTVDGELYRAFRAGRTYALFQGKRMVARYTSITMGLGPALAELLEFHLKLTDRDGRVVVPPPAYLFLPFYCDQDNGWTEPWSSFARLGQFVSWRREVIPFHAGLRSGAYYIAMERAARAEKAREEPFSDRAALIQLARKPELNSDVDAEMDPKSFQAEIDELVQQHNIVASEREKYRQRLQELNDRQLQLSAQKDILLQVRNELHADYNFSVNNLESNVECPTCGQVHQNSFAERFAIAQDEAKSADLLGQVSGDLATTLEAIASSRGGFDQKSAEASKIQELLSRHRGLVTFRQIVQREGQKEYRASLNAQITELDQIIGRLDRQITDAHDQMRLADSDVHKQEILSEYRRLMGLSLKQLRVTSLAEPDYRQIDSRLKETGSDRPRAILAYMFVMLHLIRGAKNTPDCPIVIDSPNQQDQDKVNHSLMLEFIRDHRPEGSQLILCLVDDCKMQFGGRVLTLEDKDFVLREQDYPECASEIAPFESAAFS
jgi:hypothetical protein